MVARLRSLSRTAGESIFRGWAGEAPVGDLKHRGRSRRMTIGVKARASESAIDVAALRERLAEAPGGRLQPLGLQQIVAGADGTARGCSAARFGRIGHRRGRWQGGGVTLVRQTAKGLRCQSSRLGFPTELVRPSDRTSVRTRYAGLAQNEGIESCRGGRSDRCLVRTDTTLPSSVRSSSLCNGLTELNSEPAYPVWGQT